VIKILAVCGMGLGTSVILKSRLKEALDKRGADYSLDVVDAGAASGSQADVIFTSDELADRIKAGDTKIVIVDNFTDRNEVKEKVDQVLDEMDD
jgi:PTS system ascorbate-specific IIB component